MQEFKVNDFITLRLEGKDTVIYVAGKRFQQCKYLFISMPVDELDSTDEINSIDEAAENFNASPETSINIPPEMRFWAHCSNLQTWSENGYDTRLLHSNLAFPLLKKLTDIGDKQALKIFKEEIAKRIESGYLPTIQFLWNQGFFRYLTEEELTSIHSLNSNDFKPLIEIERLVKINLLFSKDLNDIDDEQIWFSMKDGKVTALEISFTPEFVTIPESITNLRNLRILLMHENAIKYLPDSIGNLTSLRRLDLRGNQIASIPSTIKNCKKIKIIELSGNDLRLIPESIGDLTLLEKLDLNSNMLFDLPESIGRMINVKKLDIGFNHLTTLPDSIGNLKYLEDLNLMHNKLISIPESFTNLNSLKSLAINGNNLIDLPESITNLRSLKNLRIDYQQAERMKFLLPKLKEKGINISKIEIHQRLLNLYKNKFNKINKESIIK